METISHSIDLAIKEYAYGREKTAYNDLVVKKALRLRDLEGKDLLALPDSEANKIHWQIEYLTNELTILYGFKLFTDQIEKAYLDSTGQIYDAYHYRNLYLEMELYKLRESHAYLQHIHMATLDSLSLMTDIAIKKSEQIITLKQDQKNGTN